MHLKWRVMALVAAAGVAWSQASVPVSPVAFDVASIKPNNTGARSVRIGAPSPGRLNAENVWLRLVIQLAWDVKDYQLQGGPGWATSDRYDINATAGSNISFEQMKPMIRALLEDRFQLKLHFETKELPVYELIAAKSGIKLQASKEGSCVKRSSVFGLPAPGQTPPNYCGNLTAGSRSISGDGISVAQITNCALERFAAHCPRQDRIDRRL